MNNSIKHPSLGKGLGGLTIIAIIGPSGSGKDTVADILADITDFGLIVSYTTRPIREGEVDGREHYFVKECTIPQDQMLAYTEYGGYKYWVPLPCNALHGIFIYVIDEDGLRSIIDRFPDIRIIKILVTANPDIRRSRGVTEERMVRDEERQQFPLDSYNYRIYNNKSLKALKHKVLDLKTYLKTIL